MLANIIMREGSIWIIVYTISWLILFFVLLNKNKKIGISGLIILTYIIYAIASVILYNSVSLGNNFNTLELFPFIYLFGMLILSLLPAFQFDRQDITHIVKPNMFVLNSFSVVFVLVSLILLPSYLSSMGEGLVLLVVDPYGGADLYKEAHDMGVITRTYLDIPFMLFSMFSYVAVVVFFYYLTIPKSNKIILWGLSISMVINLLAPISKGLRTETVLMLFAIFAAFFLLKQWIPQERRKHIRIAGIGVVSIIVSFLIILTVSRVVSKDVEASESIADYVGQANLNFNNYGLDAGGIRYGDRTCRIFKEILFFDKVPSGPIERRSKYSKLKIDDYYFYTFVGDFTIDFGPTIAVFIFIVFSFFFVQYTKPQKRALSFSQLLFLYLSVLIPLQGGMYLFNFSDGGNYSLMAFAFMAIIFSISTPRQTRLPNEC